MKNLDGKLMLGLSIVCAFTVIIFGIQLTGSYIREEARRAAVKELEFRLGPHNVRQSVVRVAGQDPHPGTFAGGTPRAKQRDE